MTKEISPEKRGFTVGEKWIIWGVFCLLVALSTSRFAVFLGMMLISVGAVIFYQKQKKLVGAVLCLIGLLSLLFARFLF